MGLGQGVVNNLPQDSSYRVLKGLTFATPGPKISEPDSKNLTESRSGGDQRPSRLRSISTPTLKASLKTSSLSIRTLALSTR